MEEMRVYAANLGKYNEGELVEKLPDYIANNIRKLIGYFSSLEDLCEHENNLILWSGCNGMSDVAYAMVEEGCIEVPEFRL